MSARQAIDMPETRGPFGFPCLYSEAVEVEERRRDTRDAAEFNPTLEDVANSITFEDMLEVLDDAKEAFSVALATGDAEMVGKAVLAARKAYIERIFRLANFGNDALPEVAEDAMKAITPALRGAA